MNFVYSAFSGGFLSCPQDRFPQHFGGSFWAKYPYFLPCLAAATFASMALLIMAAFLKEVGFWCSTCILFLKDLLDHANEEGHAAI
jgi:hypothetical protein